MFINTEIIIYSYTDNFNLIKHELFFIQANINYVLWISKTKHFGFIYMQTKLEFSNLIEILLDIR